MRPFSYLRPTELAHAVSALAAEPGAQVMAGGTNLVDLMKYDVAHPTAVIDINGLPLKEIEASENGRIRIGALTTNAQVAYDAKVLESLPSASVVGDPSRASPQLRNAATTAAISCNAPAATTSMILPPRATSANPAPVCSAIGGVTRIHAILGASDQCIATHPSDIAWRSRRLMRWSRSSVPTVPATSLSLPSTVCRRSSGARQHAAARRNRRGNSGGCRPFCPPSQLLEAARPPVLAFALSRSRQHSISRTAVFSMPAWRLAGWPTSPGAIRWQKPKSPASRPTERPSRHLPSGFLPAPRPGDNDFKIPMAHKAIVRRCPRPHRARRRSSPKNASLRRKHPWLTPRLAASSLPLTAHRRRKKGHRHRAYAVEHAAPDALFGFVATATINRGRILSIDLADAAATPVS